MVTPSINLVAMRDALENARIVWQRHVLERMTERKIARKGIIRVLLDGERIEEYPADYPWPSALFLGWEKTRPIHVVAAFNSSTEVVAIITAYEPTVIFFEDDYKTRR